MLDIPHVLDLLDTELGTNMADIAGAAGTVDAADYIA